MEKRIAAPEILAEAPAAASASGWRWVGIVAIIVIAAALPFALSKYHVFELTMVMIYAIAVLGLNILTGYNGQISLGHGGFFAVGAYTAAILMHRYGVPYWATLPPAALIGFALGGLFGLPALRFEGPYLALVTLAMALATPQLLKYFDTWTGGQQGINLVKPMPPAGLGIDRDRWLYFVALVVLSIIRIKVTTTVQLVVGAITIAVIVLVDLFVVGKGGTSGNTQGERNEMSPAKKAAIGSGRPDIRSFIVPLRSFPL